MDTLVLEVPDDVIVALKLGKITLEDLKEKAKLSLALELFKNGTLSLEQAAKLAGMPMEDFMDELRRRKMPITDYSGDELEEIVGNA